MTIFPWADLVDGHVPPGAAGRGEHHVAAPALEHPRVVVRGQVSVEAAAAEENTELRLGKPRECIKYLPNKAFTAFEAHIGPLSCVGSRVSNQVGGFLDKTLTIDQFDYSTLLNLKNGRAVGAVELSLCEFSGGRAVHGTVSNKSKQISNSKNSIQTSTTSLYLGVFCRRP